MVGIKIDPLVIQPPNTLQGLVDSTPVEPIQLPRYEHVIALLMGHFKKLLKARTVALGAGLLFLDGLNDFPVLFFTNPLQFGPLILGCLIGCRNP